jgi:hypothetical protein
MSADGNGHRSTAPDRELPTWYFAETLPTRIPRCSECGRPAADPDNRDLVVPDDDDWTLDPSITDVAYRHRNCSAAPDEKTLQLTDRPRIKWTLEESGIRYTVTSVVFVPVTATVPAHWRIIGIPEV